MQPLGNVQFYEIKFNSNILDYEMALKTFVLGTQYNLTKLYLFEVILLLVNVIIATSCLLNTQCTLPLLFINKSLIITIYTAWSSNVHSPA